MLIGIAIFFAGFIAIFSLLAKRHALDKSKQFGVMAEILKGRHGPSPRRVLIVAFAAQLFGMCTTFAGVAQVDARRAEACRTECTGRGYKIGKIKGSKESVNGKHSFVACVCSEGTQPDLELRADSLRP